MSIGKWRLKIGFCPYFQQFVNNRFVEKGWEVSYKKMVQVHFFVKCQALEGAVGL